MTQKTRAEAMHRLEQQGRFLRWARSPAWTAIQHARCNVGTTRFTKAADCDQCAEELAFWICVHAELSERFDRRFP